MSVAQQEKLKETEIQKLQLKAALLDDLLELIEDKCFGQLMSLAERDRTVSLRQAKKLLR